MAWPDGPPKHHKLHVFVRYLTADGRKLHDRRADRHGPVEKAADHSGVNAGRDARAGRARRRTAVVARRCHGARPARLVAGPAVGHWNKGRPVGCVKRTMHSACD